ncbi:hypothetical protein ENBRE01_0173 [Enteropsectra breve]|nr:hypothetical protein ENBRE01_0173 [Enteropsectra breve]
MLHETIQTALFSIANCGLLAASIHHTNTIFCSKHASDMVYGSTGAATICSLLFLNIGIVVFSLFIIMNFNDFMLERCINLIGAYQKLRVVGG